MTPEAQMRVIAEEVGLPNIHNIVGRGWVYGTINGFGAYEHKVPDFLNDLNAMHEVEKVLRPDGVYGEWPLWDKYRKIVAWKTGDDDVAYATARERAEAFLRTLEKWDDSK